MLGAARRNPLPRKGRVFNYNNQTNKTKTRPKEPLTGAYHRFSRPAPEDPAWNLVTCHDLRVRDGISHREFWPHVVQRSAAAWGGDAEPLIHRLADHQKGLPRSRINHPRPGYLNIQGNDAPVADWLPRVIHRYRLSDAEVKSEYTEHERMARRQLNALQDALGSSLGLDRAF
jgi:hypothetical protein